MREEGLEPSRLAAQEPKSCVSASSTTLAVSRHKVFGRNLALSNPCRERGGSGLDCETTAIADGGLAVETRATQRRPAEVIDRASKPPNRCRPRVIARGLGPVCCLSSVYRRSGFVPSLGPRLARLISCLVIGVGRTGGPPPAISRPSSARSARTQAAARPRFTDADEADGALPRSPHSVETKGGRRKRGRTGPLRATTRACMGSLRRKEAHRPVAAAREAARWSAPDRSSGPGRGNSTNPHRPDSRVRGRSTRTGLGAHRGR
jgi:hypothetical protein